MTHCTTRSFGNKIAGTGYPPSSIFPEPEMDPVPRPASIRHDPKHLGFAVQDELPNSFDGHGHFAVQFLERNKKLFRDAVAAILADLLGRRLHSHRLSAPIEHDHTPRFHAPALPLNCRTTSRAAGVIARSVHGHFTMPVRFLDQSLLKKSSHYTGNECPIARFWCAPPIGWATP